MKKDRGAATDPSTSKSKKPIYKKWWFWVIIVFIGLGAYGSTQEQSIPPTPAPSSSIAPSPVETTPSVSSTPTVEDPAKIEELKAAAKQLDLDITAICTSAEADYNKFLEIMSSGNSSDLDMYNTAKTLKENLQYYNYTQLSNLDGEGIDNYKDSASLYIFVMSEVADKTMKYIDDPSTSKLSDLQSYMGNVSSYTLDVVSEKFAFLSDAGFTADEIAEMTSISESNAE